MITVIGHKTPDTDAIVSSIIFAEYLNQTGQEAQAGALGEVNNETAFVLSHWGITAPPVIETLAEGSEIALVDHNEAKQSHDDLAKCVITHIVDHHKFNLQTDSPLYIYAYPYGCTATILFRMYEEAGLAIDKEHAGLLLSAIISDTLLFRSPTTTEADTQAAEILAELAELEDVAGYADQMFAAKSDLTGKSARDILLSDFKQFELGGKNVGVGVFETTNPDNALAMADELQNEMNVIATEMGLDYLLFSIVDIVKSDNYMYGVDAASTEVITKAYEASQHTDGYFLLPGIVSRKKQIIPALEKALNSSI